MKNKINERSNEFQCIFVVMDNFTNTESTLKPEMTLESLKNSD